MDKVETIRARRTFCTSSGDTYHTLVELASLTGYNVDYLRQLAERGRLAAQRIGPKFRGFWVSTETAVQCYQEAKEAVKSGGPRRPQKR